MKRGNGEGTIYPVYKNGKLIRYAGQITVNGKRKSVYGKTKTETVQKLKELQSQVITGTYCDYNNINLYQLSNKVIDNRYCSNRINANTYHRYKEVIISFKPLWYYPIQSITTDILQDYFNSITNYSNSYIDKVSIVLNMTFSEAIELNIIPKNPLNRVLKPKSIKPDKIVEAFTINEQKLILDALEGEKYEIIIKLALNTGMRIGEILALSPDDIDFINKTILINKSITRDEKQRYIIGKTTKTLTGVRKIPITTTLEPLLRQALSNCTSDEFLFTQPNGNLIAHTTINSHLQRICKNLGIRVKDKKIRRGDKIINSSTSSVHSHILRHTYATRCIEAGMPPVVLQRLLGHKDVRVTLNTYTSVFSQFQQNSLSQYEQYMNKILS